MRRPPIRFGGWPAMPRGASLWTRHVVWSLLLCTLSARLVLAAAHQSGQARYASAAAGGGGGAFSAFDAPSTEVYDPDPALFTVAASPQVFLDSRYDPGGAALTWASDITLSDSGNAATNQTNLQTAIDDAAARVGHSRIKLPEGFASNGRVKLRKHTQGAYWTYIESTAASTYAAEGTRCDTALMGSAPTIQAEATTFNAIECDQGADYTRLVGLHITKLPANTECNALVNLNATNATFDNNQVALTDAPQWIVIDRCWVDGGNQGSTKNGIVANTREFACVESVLDGIYWTGVESHAVAAWNYAGPHKWVNCKMEAGGIGIIWGGAVPSISQLVGADVEFRRNFLTRRLSWIKWRAEWDGITRGCKNQWEVKEGRRFLVEGNVIERSPADGQNGAIIVTKVSNPGDFSYTSAATEDITFRYNAVRQSGRVWDFINKDDPSGPTAGPPSRIHVAHNLFTDFAIDDYLHHSGTSFPWGPVDNSAFGLTITGGVADLVIEHNTMVMPATGTNMSSFHEFTGSADCTGLNINNNIIAPSDNNFVMAGDGTQSVPAPVFGANVLDTYAPGWEYDDNVYTQDGWDPAITPAQMPAGSVYPDTATDIGFVDYVNGNYRLSAGSLYKGLCADGSDPGADLDAVDLATSGVAS